MMAKLVTGGVNFVLDAKAPKRKDLFLREALDVYKRQEIELPTIEQQRKIAGVLDKIQEKIKLNQKINDNLAA